MATKKSAVKDLTNGSPVKLILGFALPLLLGMLFQQFYSMVDTIIVGKFLGAKALAAVGSTGSINFMIVGFCMGVCSGFAIPVAQMFGAGAMILSAGRQGVIFAIVIFCASKLAGFSGVIASQPVSDFLTASVAVMILLQWKKKEFAK